MFWHVIRSPAVLVVMIVRVERGRGLGVVWDDGVSRLLLHHKVTGGSSILWSCRGIGGSGGVGFLPGWPGSLAVRHVGDLGSGVGATWWGDVLTWGERAVTVRAGVGAVGHLRGFPTVLVTGGVPFIPGRHWAITERTGVCWTVGSLVISWGFILGRDGPRRVVGCGCWGSSVEILGGHALISGRHGPLGAAVVATGDLWGATWRSRTSIWFPVTEVLSLLGGTSGESCVGRSGGFHDLISRRHAVRSVHSGVDRAQLGAALWQAGGDGTLTGITVCLLVEDWQLVSLWHGGFLHTPAMTAKKISIKYFISITFQRSNHSFNLKL